MRTSKKGHKGNVPLEKEVAGLLKKTRKTLALAESCSGGLISHRMTDIPGISRYYKGSVISYSNDIKTSILKVSPGAIIKYGAVSRQVAKAMAEGARAVTGADIAASITGIAGPGGGSAEKPVGTGYMAVSSAGGTITRKIFFSGSRSAVKSKFCEAVLKLLKCYIPNSGKSC